MRKKQKVSGRQWQLNILSERHATRKERDLLSRVGSTWLWRVMSQLFSVGMGALGAAAANATCGISPGVEPFLIWPPLAGAIATVAVPIATLAVPKAQSPTRRPCAAVQPTTTTSNTTPSKYAISSSSSRENGPQVPYRDLYEPQ